MCSGPTRVNSFETTRLANISKIKVQQAARRGKINVLSGGTQLRAGELVGANVGETAEDITNKKLSELFTKNVGVETEHARRQRLRKEARLRNEALWTGQGGGDAGEGSPGSGAGGPI